MVLLYKKEIFRIDLKISANRYLTTLKEGRHFFIGSSVVLLGSEVSIYLAGFYLDAGSLGAYSLGVRLATIINMSLIGANMPAMQDISRLVAKNDIIGIEKVAKRTAKLAFLGAMLTYVLVFLLAEIILRYLELSFDFIIVKNAVLIVGSGYLFSAFLGPSGAVLNMSGYEKYANLSAIAGIFFMCAVMVFSSERFGYYGVAVGLSLNIIIWKLTMTVAVRRIFKFWTFAI